MTSLGAYLIETFVTLFAVVILAFFVLYGARRLGVGTAKGPLELVGRLPIDARRAVYLVKVGKLVYVVGASESGLTKLGEIGAEGIATEIEPPARFKDLLSRVTARPDSAKSRRESDLSTTAPHEGPHNA